MYPCEKWHRLLVVWWYGLWRNILDTLDTSVPYKHHLMAPVFLYIAANHFYPFKTTVSASSNDYLQQKDKPYDKSEIISIWYLKWVHCTMMAFTVTRFLSNKAALGCDGTRACIMDVQPTTLMDVISCFLEPSWLELRNVYGAFLNQFQLSSFSSEDKR